MRVTACVLLVLLCVAVGAGAQPVPAKARPDFSGTWAFDQVKSAQPGPDGKVMLAAMLGDEFTARQDTVTLAFAIKSGNLRVEAAYKLDGSESRNTSPGAYGQPAVDVISRASWEGDRLVIVSSSVSVIQGQNVPINTRRVMWIDPAGSLIMERTGTPASEVPPSRSVYRKMK
jgi:hypothetical protein